MALDLGGDLDTPRIKFGIKVLARISQVGQDIECLAIQRDALLEDRQYVQTDPDGIFEPGDLEWLTSQLLVLKNQLQALVDSLGGPS